MKRTARRGRKPRRELLVTGIEPLPDVIDDWELDLVAPALEPLIAGRVEDRRADEEGDADAAT